MFCDKASVYVKAGDGGDGAVSFLHEKYREFGGPDGGDGGNGGNVVFLADDSLNTLYYFKTHHKLLAESGEKGGKRKKHGKNGQDLVIKVPRGTVIVDEKTKKEIGDLSEVNEIKVANGGEGGYGNAHFISSTRQAPKVSELGEPGEEKDLTLELKMIADVGLIGFPNVGKSTLLSVISAAKPKIADYEFTTLIPNLGVVEEGTFGVGTGFIAADIPGLIEGASKGKGLGDEFLRHIERTKVIVHVLDALHGDLAADYRVIRSELKHYESSFKHTGKAPDLYDRLEIVVVNKIDAVPADILKKKVEKLQKVVKSKVLLLSAAAHKGLSELLHEVEVKVKKEKEKEKKVKPKEKEGYKVFTIEDVKDDNLFTVEKKKKHYEISGKKIEKFAVRTDFANPHGILRFRDILKKLGIDKELRRKGAKEGDKIIISGKELDF